MSADNYPITIVTGEAFRDGWEYRDAAGDLVDLTGFEARAQARVNPNTSTLPVVDLTSDPAAGITLGGVAGTIDVFVGADVTAELTPTAINSPAVWAIVLISIADPTDIRPFLKGPLTIERGVIR